MKILNIAVIGCSAIANKTVIPTIVSNKKFNLVLVGSRSTEKGEVFAEKFGCKSGSYEDVLLDESVDAVYVSLPTGLHFSWGKKVLESGKHLFLEKPFTDTFTNAEELFRIAEEKKLVAMEGLAYIYHPYFKKLKEVLEDDCIGEIKLIESSFGFPHLNENDIRYNPEIGGGAILDNLIYPLSASLEIMGDHYLSKSFRTIFNDRFKVDESGFLRLDWANASANITYGFGFSYRNSIDIWGTKGTIHIERAFTKPSSMDAELVITAGGQSSTIVVPAADQFDLLIEAFYDKVDGINTDTTNEKDNVLKRMEVISEIYLSINQTKWQK